MNSSLPKLNVKHINKIVKHIAGNVKRLYMPAWGVKKKTDAAHVRHLKARSFPECGMVACFAGWSKLLATPKKQWDGLFHLSGTMCSYDPQSGRSINMSEGDRLGLTPEERFLFEGVSGTPKEQFEIVKERLRELVRNRLEMGDMDAKGIKL